MKFEIKHRYTNSILFSGEFGSLRLCVEAAVSSRADLSRAYLSRADLSRAYLSGADLSGADLSGANLGEGWKVESYRDLLWIGPLGSRNDFLMYNVPTGNLRVGCFGASEPKNLDAFVEAVKATHGESVYAREYLATVKYLRALTAARGS